MGDNKLVEPEVRKSHMDYGEIYFWTATINGWQRLLEPNHYKEIVIKSLSYLSEISRIDLFAFVIMPSHLHFIWRMLELKREPPGIIFEIHRSRVQEIIASGKSTKIN